MPVLDESLDLTLTDEMAQKIARDVTESHRNAQSARSSFDQKVAAWWERYEGVPPKRELPFRQAANLRVPLTLWVVDGVKDRIMRTIAGQDPYMRVVDDNIDTPPAASPIETTLQHLAVTDLDLRERWEDLSLNGLVEGTGIAKITRDHRARKVRDREGSNLIERMVTDKIGLGLEVIDLKDFLVANPAVVNIDDQPWVDHRVWLRWDTIVRRQRDGVYKITKKELDELRTRGKKRRSSGSYPNDQAKADIEMTEDSGFGSEDEWEFVERICRFDVKGLRADVVDHKKDEYGLEDECLFLVSLDWDTKPLRAQSYPFWNGKRNYVAYRPLPRSNRFYGRSLAGILQPLQDEVDMEQNQSLDATTLAILANLTPILPRHLKQEWERHKWQLGRPIYVDAPETFKTLGDSMRHAVTLSATQLNQILMLAERTSGISDQQLGRPSSGDKTAFEIATVQTEGNVRFAGMIERLQNANQELGYQIIEHAYQLSVEEDAFATRLEKVAGENPFADVSMMDIRQRWAVRPVGNTIIANKDLEARKWMTAFQMFREDEFVMLDDHHKWYLRMQVLKASGLSEQEAELIIGTEKEVQAGKDMKQNMMAQMGPQLAMAAAQGGPGAMGGMIPGMGGGKQTPQMQGPMGQQSPAGIPGQ